MNVSSNVENSTNVSNLIASSISKLNLSSVKKPNVTQNKEEASKEPANNAVLKEEKVIPTNEKPKTIINVEEVQKYAEMAGVKISTDDINYGIMYGRSVIADYIA